MHASSSTIAQNKKARFDFFIEEEYEGGLVLEGWEVKSLRAGKVNLTDAYILIKNHEAFLLGARIEPLNTTSMQTLADPVRTRKILLHRKELAKLIGSVERLGYTLIPLSMYWHGPHIKVKIALAKGKKTHDKRETVKQRDWEREKAKAMKKHG